jgi:hypothetical protein
MSLIELQGSTSQMGIQDPPLHPRPLLRVVVPWLIVDRRS